MDFLLTVGRHVLFWGLVLWIVLCFLSASKAVRSWNRKRVLARHIAKGVEW